MMTSDKVAVWMDQGEWALDFFGWLQKEKGSMGLKGYSHMHGYMKLFFEFSSDEPYLIRYEIEADITI